MTHDELLAKIDSMEMRYKNEAPRRNALRAVVELHKPEGEYCSGCTSIMQGYSYWPCETIEAIEKELL